MSIFHAYDIRGVYGETLLLDDVYRIGYFLPRLLDADKVLIGRDCRESSDAMFDALSSGVRDAGADVDDVGLATTPMIYWLTARDGYRASACITASHNPAKYNGIKISTVDSRPVGFETGLATLQQWVAHDTVTPAGTRGKLRCFDGQEPYLAFLRGQLPDLGGLRLAVDTGNGMGGLFARALLGDTAIYLNEALDGRFPNHGPDPLVAANREALAQTVRERGCDLGMVFDGDADRVVFVDELGALVPPDLILAVLARHYLDKGENDVHLVQDIRTSRSVAETLRPMGVRISTWKVGRAYGASRVRELGATLGGELAGHYYFRDFACSDSAMLAMLLVLDVYGRWKAAGNGTFSNMMAGISRYHASGEINFRVPETQAVISGLRALAPELGEVRDLLDIDGVRVEYDEWWFVVRASNTEPLLRLVVEAREPEMMNRLAARLSDEIRRLSNST